MENTRNGEIWPHFLRRKLKRGTVHTNLTRLIEAKDIHLYLGTTKKYDRWASNPFVIIGVFYPPLNPQTQLDLF